jgi:steroid 5-alpha reductase family enzyme
MTGYGLSMAFSGIITLASLSSGSTNIIAQLQAACFILYGLRLSAYLMYREINIPSIFRREAKGNPLARIPTILGCSFLYFCMAAPLRIAALAGQYTPQAQAAAFAGLALMYGGWALAAFGDYQKTHYKSKQGNGLVTEGIFALLRHPNYTGEQVMYLGSFLCSVAAGLFATTALSGPALAGWLAASAAGTAGIWLVLLQATASLEKKQVRPAQSHTASIRLARRLHTV